MSAIQQVILAGGITPVPVDWVGDWNAGTVGQLITLANAAASSYGVVGTWGLHSYAGSGDPAPTGITHTYLINGTPRRRVPVICAGVIYNNAAGRGIKYDLSAALAGGLYQEGLNNFLAGSVSTKSLSVSCLVRYNQVYDAGVGDYSNDTIVIEGGAGEYCTGQVNMSALGTVSRSEAQIVLTNGSTTGKGFNGSIALNTWYQKHVRIGAEGRSYEVHVDRLTGAVVNASCVACKHDASGTDLVYFGFQDYLFHPGIQPTGGGKLEYGQAEAAWTHNIFPLEPITVAPINAFSVASQTALNTVTLAWTGIACTFRVERTSNGGSSWTVLVDDQVQNKFGNESYVDTTVTYPNTYQYRVTAKIGSYSAAPVSTSAIVMVNSGFTWAQDTFESYADSVTNLGTLGSWVETTNDFYEQKIGSAHVIYGGSTSPHKAAYWSGTVSANQRSEVTLGVVSDPGYNIMVGAAVRVNSARTNWYEVIVGYVGGVATDDAYSSAGTVVQLRRVNGNSSVRVGGNYAATVAAGDQLAIEVTGTGSASRIKIQKNLAGAGWVDLATNIDPGGTYVDGGNPGVSGFNRFGADAPTKLGIDSWRSYEI